MFYWLEQLFLFKANASSKVKLLLKQNFTHLSNVTFVYSFNLTSQNERAYSLRNLADDVKINQLDMW